MRRSIVRKRSAYYQNLYSRLPTDETRLAALPMVSQKEFWEANTH